MKAKAPWVACDTRMPEFGVSVLCYGPVINSGSNWHYAYEVANWDRGGFGWSTTGIDPEYWMPLPPKPELDMDVVVSEKPISGT